MPFTIRPYEPSKDAAQVRRLVIALHDWERGLEPTLPESAQVADPYLVSLLDKCARMAGHILVAEEQRDAAGEVVGFVAVLTRVPPGEPDEVQQEYAYVSDLVVLPGHRGRGLGALLLRHAETLARQAGAKLLKVDVLARNSGAHALYRRLEFRDYGVQMVKDL